jgi:Peptidase S46
MRMKSLVRSALVAVALAACVPLIADEGMWPFNNVPVKYLKSKYGWAPDRAWLDHVRLASVRFNDGGSGSFVSSTGLVLTNHHVGANCIQKMSNAEHDYIKTGYEARTAAEELKCPDLELNVLESIEDVTRQVNAKVKPGMADAKALETQKAEEARIEKSCHDKTGLRCDIVTLYQGGEYDLYRYKKYTDVRLVFAPEFAIAFFGGDPDNFTYPRWDIDFAIFRVYDKGKPVHPRSHLVWNSAGASDGDLVLVSGNPGSTARLDTVAQLHLLRDTIYPSQIAWLERRAKLLQDFSEKSEENARIANRALFGIQNSIKALKGYEGGLLDPKVMARKEADETALRGTVEKNPKMKSYAGAWDAIAGAVKAYGERYKHDAETNRITAGSPELRIALDIVRLVAEKQKPNDQRLAEYRDSNLPSLEFELFSPAPIYPTLEKATLADAFRELSEALGENDPFVQKVLAGKSPEDRAAELVDGTKLADVKVRKELAASADAVAQSKDPMIVLARDIDPTLREIRKWHDDNVESVERVNGAEIAKAIFAVRGKDAYPDATFTLRLSIGQVKGYVEGGKNIPYETTWSGMYRHSEEHGGKPPYDLPQRYLDAREKINPDVPVDFVSTNDIIGGNSGSPVVNEKGQFVGLIFDGNIQSLPWRFVYSDEIARAVSVHPAAIITALRSIYGDDALADELEGRRPAHKSAEKKSMEKAPAPKAKKMPAAKPAAAKAPPPK